MPARPSLTRRRRRRDAPGTDELLERLERQERELRKLRRRVDGLETQRAGNPRAEPDRRRFSLRLPSLDGATKQLDIDVPHRFYVPELLESSGLGGYESHTLACWLTVLSLDGAGAAYDVGANVGPFAWLAAALSDREVIAFEPVPELLDTVGDVARQNGLTITLEPIALTDRDGQATFHLSDQTDSSNSLVAGFRRSTSSLEVEVQKLDTYVRRTGRIPHALKIDTETNEPEVLAGGVDVIREHRPWMIVEVLAGRTEERLMHVLDPLGYRWYPIDARSPLTAETTIVGDPTYTHTNWLLAPQPPGDEFWSTLDRWRAALEPCVPAA